MSALELYKLINSQFGGVELRWDGEQLSTWLETYNISEFCALIDDYLSDGGAEARLLSRGSVWIDLVPVCEYYGIDPEEIFPKPIN